MPLYFLYYTLCFLTGLKGQSPNSGAPKSRGEKNPPCLLRCFHLKSDQTIFLLDNRKLFFDPILDSTAAATPSPVLAPPLRDTVLLPQPTDLQTAGKIIHNMVKSCQESRFRRQHWSVTDQRVTPEEYME